MSLSIKMQGPKGGADCEFANLDLSVRVRESMLADDSLARVGSSFGMLSRSKRAPSWRVSVRGRNPAAVAREKAIGRPRAAISAASVGEIRLGLDHWPQKRANRIGLPTKN